MICPICNHDDRDSLISRASKVGRVWKCPNCKRSFQLEPNPMNESQQQIAREAALRLMPASDRGFEYNLEVILSAIERATEAEYGRGVTAGKLEALQYTPEERERYGKWVAQSETRATTASATQPQKEGE